MQSLPTEALKTSTFSLCAAALLLLPACQNVPKYKRANGRFDEWGGYEGKNFKPSHGVDTAIDLSTQTITVVQGTATKQYVVTPDTKLFFNGDQITLVQLPLNEAIKFTTADDRKTLVTVWYGTHTNASLGGVGSASHK